MDLEIKYQGRVATIEEIEFIKRLIAENPDDTRRGISKRLCEAWNWVQPNGALRDMVCRGFLLRLHRAGYIKLPPRKFTPNNPLANRQGPKKVDVDETPICRPLSQVKPIEIRQVRFSGSEGLFNSLIAEYHYLGYVHPVGEHLKYIVFTEGRPIGCFSWSSAVRHIECRDRFIGWSADVRKKNLPLIAYNSRFLILNWVQIPYLASHLLGRIAKVVSRDWERFYNHPIYFLETFIDTERFKGTCYKAANWIYLGNTTGRGKNDQSHKVNRSIKAVWGYPVSMDFREVLQRG
jgi:hypothetical protein